MKGVTAELRCVASAVPEPLWAWTGPSGTIYADGSKYILDTHSLSTTLIVRSLSGHDFGKYSCTADNGIGPPDRADLLLVEICELAVLLHWLFQYFE
ncbi:unnamed protein product [Gongylonema pulchrum]|uniref:Ig-like domain-containing protein n=1 Tax=Gongylonema pulchrum TaxID=637853 RepID=A0A183DBR7_9BILA|nr:unnamed protein product [Gongylonema pulchrum]